MIGAADASDSRFDARQWRALTRAYLVTDYAALLGAHGRAEQRTAIGGLLVLLFVGFATSLGPTLLVFLITSQFTAATLFCTSLALTIAAIVLGEAGTLASPEDLDIVGSRPVGSRTYFAVRATGLAINTAFTVLLTAALPMLAFLLRTGSLTTTLGAAAAAAALALTVTLFVLALHAALIRVVDGERLTSALAGVNLCLMLTLVGAYLLGFSQLVDRTAGMPVNVDIAIEKSAWSLLYPATWFASYIEIASGTVTRTDIIGVGLSLAALAGLALALQGGLSGAYASRMSEIGIHTRPAAVGGRPQPEVERHQWLRGEARVVATLFRSQLAADVNVKINVLMSVALYLGFLFLTVLDGLPRDPFAAGSGRPPAFAPFWLVVIGPRIYQGMIPSASAGAAWFFFSTPADPVELLRATRNLVFATVLAPLLLVVAMLLTYSYGNPGHALAQTTVIGAAAYLSLQIAILARPRLPFTSPLASRQSLGGVAFMVTVAVSMMAATLLALFACRSYLTAAVALAGFAVVIPALDRLIRYRVSRLPALQEFTA